MRDIVKQSDFVSFIDTEKLCLRRIIKYVLKSLIKRNLSASFDPSQAYSLYLDSTNKQRKKYEKRRNNNYFNLYVYNFYWQSMMKG